MKIGNNGNLVLGPFDESTPCLMIVLMKCQTKFRINHLTAVKSVAILENNANQTSIPGKKHSLLRNYPSEYNKLSIRELENLPKLFGSSSMDRTCAYYLAIADVKLVTLTSLVMWTPPQKVQCVLWLTDALTKLWLITYTCTSTCL
ncbi:alpha-2 adrenergic receptor [Trichonephila clavipes]|nr:alpha-2 adrenergic receptor [Trichonephila clavipes]